MSNDLMSTEIVPVECPQCGEAQNTVENATDPTAPEAQVACMVCNYQFDNDEYRRLLETRLSHLNAMTGPRRG